LTQTASRRATALVAAAVLLPSSAAAQAFTPPQGIGAFTLAWQFVDNTGHRLSDGLLVDRGQSLTTSVVADVDYGVTDRLSASLGIPYVFARYSGGLPPPSGLPVDQCACWHSSFQDLSLGVRYRFGDARWAVTPTVRYGSPSHDYPFAGEAVVGRNVPELLVGGAAAVRLTDWLPKASVQGGYTYAFVETPIPEVPINHSNAFGEFGYALTRALYVRGAATWQRTHGGLRIGSDTGNPFKIPGEFNTPERLAQRDRLGRVNYWHIEGGAAVTAGPVDFFFAITKYVAGTDTHNGQAYTAGATWYFRLPKSP
jgi:hypothetical protein